MNRSISFLFLALLFLSSNLLAQNTQQDENATQVEVQDALSHVYEGICFISFGAKEVVETSAKFVWDRVPNSEEIFYDIIIGTFVEMGLNGLGLDLGKNNPAAKCVVRDFTRTLTMIPKVIQSTEVGSTGIKFDAANVVGQIVKPLTKSAGIIFLQKVYGYDGELASEKANHLGDTLSRAIVLAGIERQKANSTLSFFEYVDQKFSFGWGLSAISQVIPKNFVVVLIAHRIKQYRVGDKVDSLVNGATALFLGHALQGAGGVFAAGAFLRAQGFKLPMAYAAAFGASYAAIAMNQLANTYLLATPARVTMDLFDWTAGQIKEPAAKMYKWVIYGTKEKDEL